MPARASAAAVPGPMAATRAGRPPRARHQLLGAVQARNDHPVVDRQLDRPAADAVDADERAEDDLVAELGDAVTRAAPPGPAPV